MSEFEKQRVVISYCGLIITIVTVAYGAGLLSDRHDRMFDGYQRVSVCRPFYESPCGIIPDDSSGRPSQGGLHVSAQAAQYSAISASAMPGTYNPFNNSMI